MGSLTIPFENIEKYLSEHKEKEPEINISILNEDEDEVKIWRMQLDIKTTRKKAIEIEKHLRKSLKDYI